MKKLIISMLLLVGVLSSCNKSDEVYSCDTAVNQKVIKNRDANQLISRYDLSHFEDFDYQMGVFVSLTPENKVRIYQEKILAEQNNPNLSSEEKIVLNELINYLLPEHYNSLNSEFLQYANIKEGILRNTYGWDDAKIFTFTNSWMTESELLDYLAISIGGGTHGGGDNGGGGTINKCNCLYNYYCFLKGSLGSTCKKSGCVTPPKAGCGVFGTSNCDGKCE